MSNSRALQDVVSRLKNVRSHGTGFMACCPAHEDHTPSLSVSTGDDGRVLLHCHAGCSFDAICAAMGKPEHELFPQPRAGKRRASDQARPTRIATYDYHDESTTLVYQTVRYEPKDFRQRRPDGKGDWVWNLKGVRRVLYRLPDLTAADLDAWIVVVEGEKDVDRLVAAGFVATTCPMGAGKWQHLSDDSVLNDRKIVLIPDCDEIGRKHVADVAQRLSGRARDLRVLELPGPGKDISDWLDAGGTSEQLLELITHAPTAELWTNDAKVEPKPIADDSSDSDDVDEDPKVRKSQATLLIELCREQGVDLFHDGDTAYASIPCQEGIDTYPVRKQAFKRWLSRAFFERFGKAPGPQAVTDAAGVLEGEGLFRGPQIVVHVRIAEHDGRIYLDLANEQRHIVEVTSAGWNLVHSAPVRFRRPNGMLPLRVPVAGGSLLEIKGFINLEDRRQFILVIAWLVGAMGAGRPTPVLNLTSEQGSGKSTVSRMLRMLCDPNRAPIRCQPRDARDLMVTANNCSLLVLDNLSAIPDWLSDALCRLSTGGGFSTRALYENDEEIIFNALRPVILNGIEELGTRPDLLDRTIRITLPRIPEERRQTERKLFQQFEEARPRLLGALLDAVSMALRNIDQAVVPKLSRMADFATWIVAAEPALPWERGEFLAAYGDNRESAHELALEASPVGQAVIKFASSERVWTGTATELLEELDGLADEKTLKSRTWPKQANGLSALLRRIAPNLRASGVEIDWGTRGKKARMITIRQVLQSIVTTVTDRHQPDSEGAEAVGGDDGGGAGDDGVTIDRHRESPFLGASDGGDDGDDQLRSVTQAVSADPVREVSDL